MIDVQVGVGCEKRKGVRIWGFRGKLHITDCLKYLCLCVKAIFTICDSQASQRNLLNLLNLLKPFFFERTFFFIKKNLLKSFKPFFLGKSKIFFIFSFFYMKKKHTFKWVIKSIVQNFCSRLRRSHFTNNTSKNVSSRRRRSDIN